MRSLGFVHDTLVTPLQVVQQDRDITRETERALKA